MRIAMLGPLEVHTDDGHSVPLGGSRLRTLLILLALEPGRVVSSELLIDGIWQQDPPMGAPNALQALASRLRRAMTGVELESHPAGYRLVIDPEAVDVIRFERLTAAGRSAQPNDPGEAARLLQQALDLWHGPALLDVANNDFFQPSITRLSELRMAALEDRIEADLRLGRGRELTSELNSLVAEYPLREGLVAALMRALVAAGRPAEALTAYEHAREALADELGADPSPALSALHMAVLRGELEPPPAASAPPTTPPAPAAAAEPLPSTNLRAGVTSFVGRDADVAEVGKLVDQYRLTTLTGPGGAGKTRLAIEAGRPLVDQLPDGVWLVELAPLQDGADIPQAVLNALGLRDRTLLSGGPSEPLDRLVAALRTLNCLLVLDNCEHLIGAAAELADRLLGECPRLRILATSREPLGITGEALWPVVPLSVPSPNSTVAEAMSSPAVRLLSDRAAAAHPGFEVSEQTVPTVVRICRALDGMPLAIELAAARLRTMSIDQLAARLDDRFRLLTGGARMASRQHQTLRAVVDWSWELLSEAERALLRRLAAFSGGATVEAAEQVCAGGQVERDLVLDLMISLTDKSLLVAGDDDRYRMLETIKAYGLERLDEAGEREALRQAHLAYFTTLAHTADPHLRRTEQLGWLTTLTAEQDNLTAALRGAVAAGDAQGSVELVAALGWYWWISGQQTEAAELTGEALAVLGAVDDESHVVALAMSALYATAGLGDERQAEETIRRAVQLVEQTASSNPLVRLFQIIGLLQDPNPAPEALNRLLTDPDPWVRGQARLNRARTLTGLADRQADAEADAEAALSDLRSSGDRWGISFALAVLAELVAARGDLAAGLSYMQQATVAVSEIGSGDDLLHMHMRISEATLRWMLGDADGSAEVITAAERDARRFSGPDARALLAQTKSELARWAGDLDTARAELARAEAMLSETVVHPAFGAQLRCSQGYLEIVAGDTSAASATLAEALTMALETQYVPVISQVLIAIADLALHQNQPREAAAVLAASTAVRGAPDLSRPDLMRVETAVRATLAEEYGEAAKQGAQATLDTLSEIPFIVTLGG